MLKFIVHSQNFYSCSTYKSQFFTLYLSYLAGKTQRRKRVEERCSDEGSSINSSSENDDESYDSAEDSAGSLKDFIVQSDIP